MTAPLDHPRATRLLPPLYFASLVCVAMLGARYAQTGQLRFSGLFGNVLLAWIPMIFTLLVGRLHSAEVRRPFWLGVCAVCWFLFFPNAHYIVTDMIHLKKYGMDGIPKWFDLLLIMAFAWTGLFLGCLSLYFMEILVRQRFGRQIGWFFAAGMLALGSFGIYLGRFLRLDSWDVVARPAKLVSDLLSLTHPVKIGEVFAFSFTFFAFSAAAYWFFAAALQLHAPEPAPAQSTTEN